MTDTPILISLNRVCELTTLSRPTIKKYRDAGDFPQPVPLGFKRIGFVRAEVEAWISDRIAKRGAAA